MQKEILEVQDLKVYYKSVYGDYKAVDGVSFKIYENEIFGIAGESGCGKSTLVEGVLNLVRPPGFIPSGKVIFLGTDILSLPERELDKLRWSKMAYIPQGSMNSLNPVMKIEEQIMDAILDHSEMTKEEAKKVTIDKLKEVGLSEIVGKMYPHELSGGMKQRSIISSALSLNPVLIVADEPTTALDVVVQNAVLKLIFDLKEKYGMTVMFISHDMAAHANLDDRIGIMYAGKLVEIGSIYDIFDDPLHPYSRGLVEAIPSIDRKRIIKGIPGMAPSPLNWPPGCRFHPRCKHAFKKCSEVEPILKEIKPGRSVACHLYGELP